MKKINTITLAMAFMLAAGLPLTSSATVIYQNDFETDTSGFSGITSTQTNAGSKWLGSLSGGQSTVLGLSGLTHGSSYSLAFDLFAGNSLDGSNSTYGMDYFRVDVDGDYLVDATFSNILQSGFNQTYSDATPLGTGSFAPQTGADAFSGNSSIYYFGHDAGNPIFTFTATATTANISFVGASSQSYSDEWFAIDNVVVSGNTTTVPEPGSLALIALGLTGLGFSRRKKA
jgi:hypothetical protein